jgi:hypothetical protein
MGAWTSSAWKSCRAEKSLVAFAKRVAVERPTSVFMKEIARELKSCLVGLAPLVAIICSYARNHGGTLNLVRPKTISADLPDDDYFLSGAYVNYKNECLDSEDKLILTVESSIHQFSRTDKNNWVVASGQDQRKSYENPTTREGDFRSIIKIKNGFFELCDPPTQALFYLAENDIPPSVPHTWEESIRRIFRESSQLQVHLWYPESTRRIFQATSRVLVIPESIRNIFQATSRVLMIRRIFQAQSFSLIRIISRISAIQRLLSQFSITPHGLRFIGLDGNLMFFFVHDGIDDRSDVLHIVALDWASCEWLPRTIAFPMPILTWKFSPFGAPLAGELLRTYPRATPGSGVLFLAFATTANQLFILTYCTHAHNFGQLVHVSHFNIESPSAAADYPQVSSFAYFPKTGELFITICWVFIEHGVGAGFRSVVRLFCL